MRSVRLKLFFLVCVIFRTSHRVGEVLHMSVIFVSIGSSHAKADHSRHEKVFAMRQGSRFREVTGAGTAWSTKNALTFRSSNLLTN